jgi:uncharacterized protein (TIGR03437 family)
MFVLFRALIFFPLLAEVASAQIVVNTVAGGKIPTGVAAQEVAIGTIGGLARDASGNLVFSEIFRNVIRRIRTDGTIETIAGTGESGFSGDGGPARVALLNSPGALQYDSTGNLYVADNGNHRIRRIDVSGIITTAAGTGISALAQDSPSEQLGQISSLAISLAGSIYVAEQVKSPLTLNWYRIRRLTPGGPPALVAGALPADCGKSGGNGDGGPASAAEFCGNSSPVVAFDGTNNLYVTDNTVIRRVTADGTIHQLAAAPVTVTALAVEPDGTMDVAAGAGIERIALDGSVKVLTGGLSHVTGLVVDANGILYFAESDLLGRIRRLTGQGIVETLAGGAPAAAPDGTPAGDAWFLNPTAIAVSRAGDLDVFEGLTCTIRRIGSDGALATVAGTGKCGNGVSTGPVASTDLSLNTIQLAADSQNRVYGTNPPYAISPEGAVTSVPGLFFPNSTGGIAVDSKDSLYGFNGNTVVRVAPGGTPQNFITSGQVQQPYVSLPGFPVVVSLGADVNDSLYLAGPFNYYFVVVRFDQNGLRTVFPNIFAAGYRPSVTGDATGNAWLADGSRLSKATTGAVSLMGQIGGYSGDGGPLIAAFLQNPSQVASGPSGEIYVLDAGNNRVRKINGSVPKDPPVISPGGVVNAASFAAGPVAPGELISIFGSNFGPTALLTNTPQNNSIPPFLGNMRVFFGGFPGVITAATANQINVFVPYELAGSLSLGTVSITVDVDGVRSAPATVPLTTSALGLASADASGKGQGAILNQDGSYNSSANPAPGGSVVSLFGTGEGAISPALPDGALVISTPYSTPVASPLNVTIGGQKAEVLYAGSAPWLPVGVIQLNVRIPAGVTPGNAPISVTLGSSTTTAQITVAVQ